ncbi:hypothetical protein fugu_002000 [Takifugu bimaculatus]|uniref:DH domain-containing protein n=1 Tax=Takifugu bimaculatus TaxID=433685 RepID=A0A4Z2BNH2_9TELE|nr:hypothetical protein fugu_002000 [Takifugu bimaculatus]
MSAQEEPLKPQAKPRPEIPPKPSPQPGPSPPTGDAVTAQSVSGGKVKSIVSKFSRQDSVSNESEDGAVNGSPEAAKIKRLRRPPTIKPKPKSGRASLPMRTGGEHAPPLPMKRSQKPKVVVPADGGNDADVEGSRSEPDGKEVEVGGGGGAEAEHNPDTPLPSSCELNCSCLCHLQWPGMKLIWVPVDADGHEEDEEDEEKGEADEAEEQLSGEDGEEWEDYEEVEVGGCEAVDGQTPVAGQTAGADDGGMLKQSKEKFQQSLNILMAEGQRRRSDPGPQSCSRARRHPSQSVQSQIHPAMIEEENIYEATLPVVESLPRKNPTLCKELDIPLIKVRKPARRSKLSTSTSDPTSEFQTPPSSSATVNDVPPAVPPRIPLTPVHRAGIPLPQPTLEEWRTLRPSSPGGLSPQRAITPPLNSPHRPPPPPPPNPRRLSCASLQSLTEKKEENGEVEGKKEEELLDRRGSLQRQLSFTWESRLQDEPLYQTYRATVITKEIRRQTVCRNISKTSLDFSMDWEARQAGIGAPRGSPVPTPCQSTLWQELPSVRESGVLERLTPEECKYQESMFEVLTSETSYLRSLRVLTEHFQDSRDLEETMIIRDKKTLFSSILRVREVSERFLKDLEDRIFEDVAFPDICDIIHYHAQHNFPAYIDYVRNQIYQEKTYTTLM